MIVVQLSDTKDSSYNPVIANYYYEHCYNKLFKDGQEKNVMNGKQTIILVTMPVD